MQVIRVQHANDLCEVIHALSGQLLYADAAGGLIWIIAHQVQQVVGSAKYGRYEFFIRTDKGGIARDDVPANTTLALGDMCQ